MMHIHNFTVSLRCEGDFTYIILLCTKIECFAYKWVTLVYCCIEVIICSLLYGIRSSEKPVLYSVTVTIPSSSFRLYLTQIWVAAQKEKVHNTKKLTMALSKLGRNNRLSKFLPIFFFLSAKNCFAIVPVLVAMQLKAVQRIPLLQHTRCPAPVFVPYLTCNPH